VIHIAKRYRAPELDIKCETSDCQNLAHWHVDFLDERPVRITELCSACMEGQTLKQEVKWIE